MNIKLYTTHCPQCKVLEMKLAKKGIQYEECDDVEKMKQIGIKAAPALEVDGDLLSFKQAINWVNEQ